jgi:hypothetical protein
MSRDTTRVPGAGFEPARRRSARRV